MQQNFHMFFVKCGLSNSLAIALCNLIYFYCEYHFRGIIEKMQGSHFEI